MNNRSVALAIACVVPLAASCGPPDAKWRVTQISADHVNVAVEIPIRAKPLTSGPWSGETADLGKIRFLVIGARNAEFADMVSRGGHAVAEVANGAIANIGASWHTAVSAGDFRGAELTLKGRQATGTLRLFARGNDVVMVGCFAEGTFGIGREVARMKELCPRFYESFTAR